MDTAALNNRIRVLLIFTGVALCVLFVRLWILQLTPWTEYYTRLAAENRSKIVWEEAPRGLVLDRAGRPLIENRSRWDVEVLPADFPGKKDPAGEHEIRLLAQILAVSTPQVRAALAEAFKQQALESVPLKDIGEDVPFKIVAQIEARRFELKGIHVGSHVERYYPNNDLAAHLLGYARAINADQYDTRKNLLYPETDNQSPPSEIPDTVYDPASLIGQNGVEKLFEDYPSGNSALPLLQGRRGFRLFEVNPSGEPTGPPLDERKPAPGATVCLTIDRDLQKVAEDALDQSIAKTGKVGAAVLVDVRTGEILVLASRPAFDANKWVKRFSPQEYLALASDPRHPLINHAISDLYAPGSIFKMISATAAFSTTKLTVNDTYNCPGIIYVGADHHPFRCWKPGGHGEENFYSAMAESCDIYFYNLVLSQGLTSDSIAKYARLFGLGSPTGIGLVGENAGFVPDPQWKKDKLQEAWYTGDSLNYVIGQGWLSVTPLQMAMVTAAVANGGYLLRPRLVSRILWPDWLGYGPQLFTQPDRRKLDVDDRILAEVRQGMRDAVEMPHGTASVMRGLGVSVAGKTGSAQHYPLSRPTHAWFTCFAPVENPRYACCVFIEEGGHGSAAAAPVARKILAKAFGVSAGAGGAAAPGD